MQFEWDANKNDANIHKHGVSFQRATQIWRRPQALLIKSDERGYDEDRFIAFGMLPEGVLLVVVHTYRDEFIRIISARKAEPKERKYYYEKIYRAKR